MLEDFLNHPPLNDKRHHGHPALAFWALKNVNIKNPVHQTVPSHPLSGAALGVFTSLPSFDFRCFGYHLFSQSGIGRKDPMVTNQVTSRFGNQSHEFLDNSVGVKRRWVVPSGYGLLRRSNTSPPGKISRRSLARGRRNIDRNSFSSCLGYLNSIKTPA